MLTERLFQYMLSYELVSVRRIDRGGQSATRQKEQYLNEQAVLRRSFYSREPRYPKTRWLENLGDMVPSRSKYSSFVLVLLMHDLVHFLSIIMVRRYSNRNQSTFVSLTVVQTTELSSVLKVLCQSHNESAKD